MNQFDFVKMFDYDEIEYQPKLCNFKKQNTENKKLYSRNLPVDNIKKNIILDFKPINTSLGLDEQYRKQIIETPSTQELMTCKELDYSYCHQNFANIDDESFLFNINKKATDGKDFNIKKKIVNYAGDFEDNSFRTNYLNKKEGDIEPNNTSCPMGSTKRKIIINPDTMDKPDQKWCIIDNNNLVTKSLFAETQQPVEYTGNEYSTIS